MQPSGVAATLKVQESLLPFEQSNPKSRVRGRRCGCYPKRSTAQNRDPRPRWEQQDSACGIDLLPVDVPDFG
jgi:hypothetical protein